MQWCNSVTIIIFIVPVHIIIQHSSIDDVWLTVKETWGNCKLGNLVHCAWLSLHNYGVMFICIIWSFLATLSLVRRECPRRPCEIKKMWHTLEKLISLIFCSEIPHDKLISLICSVQIYFCFSKILEKLHIFPTTTKWWALKGRASTQELRSWKVQKQVCFSSFCMFKWKVLANCLSQKPGVLIQIWIHSVCLKKHQYFMARGWNQL